MFYNDKQLNHGRSVIKRFAQLKKYKTNNLKVLDLGAGQGVDLDVFKNQNSKIETFAFENCPSNVEVLEKHGHTVSGVDMEREVFPFSDNSIDVIIMNQIMEHIKDVFWVIHECTRVLKVNGDLIIGVPNLASLHNRIILLLGDQPTCIQVNSAHVRGYTKNGLLNFMKIFSGYELMDFSGSNFYPFSPLLAVFFSRLLPTMSVSVFFRFTKTSSYDNEFIKFPVEEKLATNYFIG